MELVARIRADASAPGGHLTLPRIPVDPGIDPLRKMDFFQYVVGQGDNQRQGNWSVLIARYRHCSHMNHPQCGSPYSLQISGYSNDVCIINNSFQMRTQVAGYGM